MQGQSMYLENLTSINKNVLWNNILQVLAKHIFVLSSPPSWATHLVNFYFFKGNITLGHKCIIRRFNYVLFTNWIGRWFLTTKRLRSCKNYFCCTSFFKGSFWPKKNDIALLDAIGFFNICLSNTHLARLILPPQMFLQSQHGLHLHVFSRLLFHWFYNMIKLDTSIGLL